MEHYLFQQLYAEALTTDMEALLTAGLLAYGEQSGYWRKHDVFALVAVARKLETLTRDQFRAPLEDLIRRRRVGVVAPVPTASGELRITTSYDPKLLEWRTGHIAEGHFWAIFKRMINDSNIGGLPPT